MEGSSRRQALKRTRTSSNEGDDSMEAKKTSSVVFTTFKRDKMAVNLVSENLNDFSSVVENSGYDICVEFRNNDSLVLLTPISTDPDARKAIHEMETLIDKKKKQKECEKDPKKFRKQQNGLLKKEIEKLKDQLKKMEIDAFLETTNMEGLKNSATTLAKMGNRIEKHQRTEMDTNSPFRWFTANEKKTELLQYLDMFLSKMDEREINKSRMKEDLNMWLMETFETYPYKPKEKEKKKISVELKEKYGLDNVVGTVNYFTCPYGDESHSINSTTFIALALLDKKIVAFSYEQSWEKTIEWLQASIELSELGNYKFAIDRPVDEKYSEHLVHCTDPAVLEENENVIKWYKNNFKCLQHGTYGLMPNVFMCIYNMAIQYYEEAVCKHLID